MLTQLRHVVFWSHLSSSVFLIVCMLYQDFEIPSDTKAALLFLKSVLPLSKFEGIIPAIVLKHQLYCVMKDKTLVDRQLVSIHPLRS